VAETTSERLFANVSDAELARLGVDENTRIIARLLTSEAHLDAMQRMIPDVQYAVLLGLACGQTPEEVWAWRRSPAHRRRHAWCYIDDYLAFVHQYD
jgi:hypothetical protein